MKELIICGTRPDVIKLAPVIKQIECVVVNTGQHREMANEALDIFGIEPQYNLNLMTKTQTPEDFLSRCLTKICEVIKKENPDRVWVQGDTITALAGALAGYLNKKELIHLEAGLRSGNKYQPFPEEYTRKMIDAVVDIRLCPTWRALENLKKEGLSGVIVGNTIVDALNMIELPEKKDEQYVLLTLHRREVIGKDMVNILKVVKEISKKIKIIFPCHPNPVIRNIVKDSNIEFIEPVNYREMLGLIRGAKFIMTDSGGIQEEAPSFGVPVIVLRNFTERQELIDCGLGYLVGWNPQKITETADMLLDEKLNSAARATKNPFGDGNTVIKIKQYLGI